jgi:NodT family efflux transporter outer membrane factor (OMF) lipoprotein
MVVQNQMRVPAALAGLVLVLVACAPMAPLVDPGLPFSVPPAWANANGSATGGLPMAQWWQRFDDPLLSNLVNQALMANTSVNGARASLRQARALRDVAAAGLLPSIGSSAASQRNFSGNSSGPTLAANNFRVGLDASWEIDVFGANQNVLNESDANARASAASLGDVQVSIAAEVALAYVSLRSSQARLGIVTANLANQLETLQITRWRLQAGLVTSLEAVQALATTEQTRAQLPALQTGIEQTRHALAVLTGQPPAALLDVLHANHPVPQVADALALSLPAETLRQRPDVRAAEYRVAGAVARVSQAQAARAPNFKIGGSLGLSALTLGSLFSVDALAASLLASIALPIFDGGAGIAGVRAHQAALDQARLVYQGAVLAALMDVENALVALRGNRQRLLHLQQAANAAAESAQLARQRYSSGLVDFQTVLETLSTELNTQDSVAGTLGDISADHVRLFKALGGGWIPDTNNGESRPVRTAYRIPAP